MKLQLVAFGDVVRCTDTVKKTCTFSIEQQGLPD